MFILKCNFQIKSISSLIRKLLTHRLWKFNSKDMHNDIGPHFNFYTPVPLKNALFLQWKSCLIRGMVCLEGGGGQFSNNLLCQYIWNLACIRGVAFDGSLLIRGGLVYNSYHYNIYLSSLIAHLMKVIPETVICHL